MLMSDADLPTLDTTETCAPNESSGAFESFELGRGGLYAAATGLRRDPRELRDRCALPPAGFSCSLAARSMSAA